MIDELTFHASDGTSVTLDVEQGAKGLFAPPATVREEGVPGAPGARFRNARHNSRPLTFPVTIVSDDIRTEMETIANVLDPSKGQGILDVGTGREIDCVYEGGLDVLADMYPQFCRAAIAFRASYPYWRDTAEQSVAFGLVGAPTLFFPILPIELTNTDVAGDTNITIAGATDTWPVYRIDGPGVDPSIVNTTTGEHISFTATLTLGDTIVVDTAPGVKAVTLNGDNAYASMSADSTLFPLRRGTTNAISVLMTGGTGASLATITYRNYWLGP